MIIKTTKSTFPLGQRRLFNNTYVTIIKQEKKVKTVHTKIPRYVYFPKVPFWWNSENEKYYDRYYSCWKLKDEYFSAKNRPTYEYTFTYVLYTVQLTSRGEKLLQIEINALAKRMAKLTRFLG